MAANSFSPAPPLLRQGRRPITQKNQTITFFAQRPWDGSGVGQAIKGIQDGTKKNIDNVERSAKNIEEVTKLANTSGESLRQIVSLAEVTTDQVRSLATASEEQSSGSEEIHRSIEDVNRVSMETSEAMRQSAQAVGELAHQDQILKTLIAEMRADGGSRSAALSSGKKALALGRA